MSDDAASARSFDEIDHKARVLGVQLGRLLGQFAENASDAWWAMEAVSEGLREHATRWRLVEMAAATTGRLTPEA